MILKGAELAEKIVADLAKRPVPRGKLVVVQVGDDPVSTLYVAKKKELAEKLGVDFQSVKLSAEVTQSELEKKLEELSRNSSARAVVLQLPLPMGLDRQKAARKISPRQDVDGFRFILGEKSRVLPPTVLAINELLDFYRIEKSGKNILVVGGGFLVGKPLAEFWRGKGLSAEILAKNDPDYQDKLRRAEIVVVATGGKKKFSSADFSSHAIVVDASTVNEGNEIHGDVGAENWSVTSSLAPVPGGLGPVTVAILLRNFYSL